MADHADRRSPLQAVSDGFAAASRDVALLHLAEVPFRTQLSVRATPGTPAATSLELALGVSLPSTPCTSVGRGGLDALWMGPDEWLVVAEEGAAPPAAELEAVAGRQATVVDVSAQRTIVELAGAASRELLAKGCSLDLHPRAFPPGACAQTMLARSQVVLLNRSPDRGWWILVTASFAGYLADWLLDAALEYGPAPAAGDRYAVGGEIATADDLETC